MKCNLRRVSAAELEGGVGVCVCEQAHRIIFGVMAQRELCLLNAEGNNISDVDFQPVACDFLSNGCVAFTRQSDSVLFARR